MLQFNLINTMNSINTCY